MAEVLTEDTMVLVNRLAPELGLLVTATKSFHKIVHPGSGYYMYIAMSRRLGTINTNLPLPKGEPGTKDLEKPLGSVTCHVLPELEHVERFLRMLPAAGAEPFKPTKNRPFAVTKMPAPRRPNPVVPPVPMSEIPAAAPLGQFEVDEEDPRPAALQKRLWDIKAQARKGRISRWMEHGFERDLAERIADGLIHPDDAREHVRAMSAAEGKSDSLEGIALEAGVEFDISDTGGEGPRREPY